MGTLDDKLVWITGAGTGIGLAGAKELAEAGARVILSGRRQAKLDEAVDVIAKQGGKATALAVDVTKAKAVAEAAAKIAQEHGPLDILVNSAGGNVKERYWKNLTPEHWDNLVSTNLNSTFYCIQAVLPAMRRRKAGQIINIASWAGRFESAMAGGGYSAAKHGVVVMTMSLNREECVNGIRATAICPGEVATPILLDRPVPPGPDELARMLQPDDLGRTIRFVAEMPAHVCINEILMAPTWNRGFLGGKDLERR
ncbi:MAG: SDR family oxidoreductase [Proteobacteria bacterium]|nr:SDR family oxidoreductase [Pseudomonadota bacterium]MBI3496454.1 SDR family oxidoreductase [Pseudomonadota bacterium]